MTGNAGGDFDWIDDAFDDRKSQDHFGAVHGMKAAGCAIVAAVAIVVALACFALFAGFATAIAAGPSF